MLSSGKKKELITVNFNNLRLKILGEEYSITFSTPEQDIKLIENAGYCDSLDKKIVINKNMGNYNILTHDESSKEQLVWDTIKHEIFHAFFFESGLCGYGNDEQLINWLAFQFEKFNNCLGELSIVLGLACEKEVNNQETQEDNKD